MPLPPVAPFPPLEPSIGSWQGILSRLTLRLPFRPFLQQLGRLPIIGGVIAREIERILQGLEDDARPWAEAAMGPLVDLLQRGRAVWHWEGKVTLAAVEAGIGAIWRVRYQTLPFVFQQAIAWIEKRIQDVVTLAYGLHGQALDYATQVGRSAEAYALALQQQAIEWTEKRIQDVVQLAYGLHGQALDYATQVGRSSFRYAEVLQAQETGYAQALNREQQEFTQRVGIEAEGFATVVGRQVAEYARALSDRDQELMRKTGVQAEEYARALALGLQKQVTQIEQLPCIVHCDQLGALGQSLAGLDFLALIRLAAEAERNAPAVGRRIAADIAGPMAEARNKVLDLIHSV